MNTKLILVIVLILIIFLLYKNINNKQENFSNSINTRYIRIEGGQLFSIAKVEVFDMNGKNILKPLNEKYEDLISEISGNNMTNYLNNKTNAMYKNQDEKTIYIGLEYGGLKDDNSGPIHTIIDGSLERDKNNNTNYFHGNNTKNAIFIQLQDSYQIKEIKIYPLKHDKKPIDDIIHRLKNIKITLFDNYDIPSSNTQELIRNYTKIASDSIQIPKPKYILDTTNNYPLPIVFNFEQPMQMISEETLDVKIELPPTEEAPNAPTVTDSEIESEIESESESE
jgi:hypothetical protein